MSRPQALDVSHLKSYAFGHRDPMWWAVAGLMAIEGMVFVLMVATYFYMKDQAHRFPSEALGVRPVVVGLANAALLISTIPVIHWAKRSAEREVLTGMRASMTVLTLQTAGCAVLRWFEFQALPMRWDSSAFGSAVWMLYGLHAFHLVSSIIENGVMAAVLFIGPVEKKHLVDVDTTSNYSYFVAVSWLPILAVVLIDGWRAG